MCCDEKFFWILICFSGKKDLLLHCYVAKQSFGITYFTDILFFEKFSMNYIENWNLFFCFQRCLFILKSVVDKVILQFLRFLFFLIYELNNVVSIHSNVFYPATSTLKMLHVHFSWARFVTICLLCKFFIYQCFADKLLTFYDFSLLSSGKTRITKQKLEVFN